MASGTLYVVATPIGNLEDITLRALRVLREVDLIAAEDTRRTARLLHHYAIATATTSYHQHNERTKTPGLIERLLSGQSIALVSDAGTPLVSDPGQVLVAAARDRGVRVTPVPGPSAVMAVLSAAGIKAERFLFVGFPPRRSNARKQWLTRYVQVAQDPVVLFEAPHRIGHMLEDALDILGDRQIIVAREVTKIHEEVVNCPISAAIQRFGASPGELVIVFLPEMAGVERVGVPDGSTIAAEIMAIARTRQVTAREAAAEIASRYRISTNEAYRAYARHRSLGRTPNA